METPLREIRVTSNGGRYSRAIDRGQGGIGNEDGKLNCILVAAEPLDDVMLGSHYMPPSTISSN